MSTEKWPRVVKSGNVSTKVYRIRHETSATGWTYVLAYHKGGQRLRQKFADPSQALAEARLKADQLNAGRVEGASMTSGDRDDLQAAREITGKVPLLAALREWKLVHELTHGHAIVAAEAWALKNTTSVKKIKIGDAVDAFIQGKEDDKKQGERTYRSKLEPLRRYFGEATIDSITVEQLTEYLRQYADGVTRNDFRKRAIALWKWAQKSKYIPHGVQLEIENTERAKEKKTDIGIITPATFERLLEFFRVNHSEHLAALVLAGFGAIRADEIHGKREDRSKRQLWEDIDLTERHLNVSVAKTNTPSWRLVELSPAAIEWLRICPNQQGAVCEPGAMEKVRSLALAANFQLPDNCFRHSAISYKIAVTGDKEATATWAGNSVSEIDRRYRRPMPKKAGEQWFEIRPSAN